MEWLLLLLFPIALYGFFILWFYYGWVKLNSFIPTHKTANIFVSIVIAARNEAENLPLLLNDLAKQSYPENLFEIVIVDDHSTDKTVDLVKQIGFPVAFVARYSPRPGTVASRLYPDDIPAGVKKTRWEILDNIINKDNLNNRPLIP